MRKLVAVIGLVGLLGTAPPGQTQEYPTRSVMMIVPHAPGSGVDIVARIVAERMRETLGQAVVVENIPAGAGTVGVERAARAAPDGYTIAYGDQTSFVISSLTNSVRYDVLKDFEPVALLSTSPPALVARNELPSSLTDLIAGLRATTGSVSIGTFGKGSGPYVVAAAFENLTGARLQMVHYRGVAPALQDLIAGRLDLQIARGCRDARPSAQRQAEGLRGPVRSPFAGRTRRPHHRAGRRTAASCHNLARHLGAKGNAERCARKAPSRGGGRVGPPGRATARCRSRPGNCAA